MFHFDMEKTVQAAAVLLKHDRGQRMGRLRLLKLLYLVDRQSIADTGEPVTGDQPVAMRCGPVLSRTYDLIKGSDDSSGGTSNWSQCIESDGTAVHLVADPGTDALSRYELELLGRISGQWARFSDSDLIDLVHHFKEWKDPGSTSVMITFESMLEAVGRGSQIEDIRRETEELHSMDVILGRAS